MSRSVAYVCDQISDACAVLESAANRVLSELEEVRRRVEVFGKGGNSNDSLIDDDDFDSSQAALAELEGSIRSKLDEVVSDIREAQREISVY